MAMQTTGSDSRPDIDIREITEDELGGWGRALDLGFMRPDAAPAPEARRAVFDPGRSLGAYDGERCVGTFRSFATELTVPGGAVVPADAISNVTVSATHRRRGLLSRMMARDLAAASERGDAVAILIAAEYRIYGRFGFGPATRCGGLEIDLTRAGGLRSVPGAEGGRIDFATMEEVRKVGPALFDRYRRTQPGAIERSEATWRLRTGDLRGSIGDWKEPFVVLHRDAADQVTGMLTYSVADVWEGKRPDCTLVVHDHLALDRATAVALWRFAFSVDWVRRVEVRDIAPDDPLPLLLDDPRAARATERSGDFMWVRVLDMTAAFGARTYGAPGRVVFAVSDPAGYAEGRWALETAPDGSGSCTRTADPADLALGVGALSSLYLGGETVSRLTAAGLVEELVPGAAVRADLTLRTPDRPWCPDMF
ncbi:GNAT family N-acetyltransferase [Peterkaempfera bronchialis]|uniref:GNAT family N-acetyltransferase n=1 Tax=Peterkaempfera bronchialis TaxID=2126346 RepID=UPI001E63399B|nr:GNAT family N-acetyltransferase [Peterkaempfera bronchialis]